MQKCTRQETMHTGGKIFDALDFGPSRWKVLKCNWQKVANVYEKNLMHWISAQQEE